MCVRRCVGIGDEGLVSLSNGCKNLRRLILSYCHLVTDRGIGCLGFLPELWDVEMRGLPKVMGSGLRKLAAGCLRLAELDLKHCGNIDDLGFWALACYAKNLQQVLSYFFFMNCMMHVMIMTLFFLALKSHLS